MRSLIFSTLYLRDQNSVDYFNYWWKLFKFYNRDVDLLVIDSNSPQELIDNLDLPLTRKIVDRDDPFTHILNGRNFLSFIDNIGHLVLTGKDGWGRAFVTGIANAIHNKYDYVAHIEYDMLFKGSAGKIFEQMEDTGCKVVAPRYNTGVETGLMFMNVKFLDDIDLIYDYNYKHIDPKEFPEIIIANIIGEKICYKNWIGCRDDGKSLKDEEVGKFKFITHCSKEHMELFYQSAINE